MDEEAEPAIDAQMAAPAAPEEAPEAATATDAAFGDAVLDEAWISAAAASDTLASEPPDEGVESLFDDSFAAELDAAETDAAASIEPPTPLTTREIIERARAAARAAERERPSAMRPAARPLNDSVLESLAFGRPRRRPGGGTTGALMVAGLLAAVSLAAGGFVVMEGQPQGKLPQRVADALALVRGETPKPPVSAQPLAAIALAPKPDAAAAPPALPADASARYANAVASVTAGDAGGVGELRRLADAGYAPAEFYLSKLYEDGKGGLPKDPIEARIWTEKAADGGDRAAMHNLALDYFEGVGGERDAAAAAEWFRRAADLGLLDSQFNLAGLYEHGQGVSQNSAEAYKWYLIASKAGDAEARASALRVRAGLTQEARAVAERAAANFTPAAAGPAAASATAAPAGSPDLVTAQRALNQLGYYQGPTDGLPSPALRLAIAAYQRDQSLPVTGAADAATVGKLAVYTR
jgi:localization factor PodJL